MVFLINCLFSTFFSYVFSKRNSKALAIVVAVILTFFWTLIIGGQEDVGTDYKSYMYIFSTPESLDYFNIRNELGFSFVIRLLNNTGFYGQSIFFIIGLLCNILFFTIAIKTSWKDMYIFIFLFITVSTLFHNQMNGIRQSVAVYFITLACLELSYGNKKFFGLYYLIASSFHISSLSMIFYLFINRIKLTVKRSYMFLCSCVVLGIMSLDAIIQNLIYLIPQYASYGSSSYLEPINIVDKLSKLVLLPLYIWAISAREKLLLNKQESLMFNIGIISYGLRIACLTTSVTNRLAFFFFILSIYPLFYFLSKGKLKKVYLLLIYTFLLSLYFIKVIIFPIGEYSYNTWFYNII